MANKEEILAGLAEIVNEETGVEVEDVQLDKSFTEDLDIDSISMMRSSKLPSPTKRLRTSRPLATQSTSSQTQPKL